MRWSAALAFLVIAGLAGCAQDAPTPSLTPTPTATATPGPLAATDDAQSETMVPTRDLPFGEPYRLACDPVADCAVLLQSLPDVQSEPFAAVDPNDATRMAVGVQTRTVAASGEPVWPLRFFVSDDGGTSWQETAAPFGELRADLHADPVIVFGPDGRLHVSGLRMAAPGVPALGPDVAVATSTDFGATWTSHTLTSDRNNDRQWLGVGPDGSVVAVWQVPAPNVVVPAVSGAWSRDAGMTWSDEVTLVESCNLPSTPIVDGTGFTFLCSPVGGAGDGCNSIAWRVEWGNETAAWQACARDVNCGTNMLAARGDLWVTACLGLPGRVAASRDGGATWGPSVAVADLVPEAGERGLHAVFWMDVDPHGGIHLLLTDFAFAYVPAAPVGGLADVQAMHAVLDSSGNFVAATLLSDPSMLGLPASKGEFGAIATGHGAGLVAWVGEDHRVRTVALAPPDS